MWIPARYKLYWSSSKHSNRFHKSTLDIRATHMMDTLTLVALFLTFLLAQASAQISEIPDIGELQKFYVQTQVIEGTKKLDGLWGMSPGRSKRRARYKSLTINHRHTLSYRRRDCRCYLHQRQKSTVHCLSEQYPVSVELSSWTEHSIFTESSIPTICSMGSDWSASGIWRSVLW